MMSTSNTSFGLTYFTNTPLHSERKAKMVKGLHLEIDLYESDF